MNISSRLVGTGTSFDRAVGPFDDIDILLVRFFGRERFVEPDWRFLGAGTSDSIPGLCHVSVQPNPKVDARELDGRLARRHAGYLQSAAHPRWPGASW
jgi:hypothetical protein